MSDWQMYYHWQLSLQVRYVLALWAAVKLLNALLIGDPLAARTILWFLRKR